MNALAFYLVVIILAMGWALTSALSGMHSPLVISFGCAFMAASYFLGLAAGKRR